MDFLAGWLGVGGSRLRYGMATVRTPLRDDEFQAISSCWRAREQLEALTNIAARPAMKADFMRQVAWDEQAYGSALRVCELQRLEHFPVVGLLTDEEGIQRLRSFPFVEYVHQPDVSYDIAYLCIVLGLHKVLQWDGEDPELRGQIVHLSLGPPNPYRFEPNEPMNVATRIVAERGHPIFVAAGNSGPADDSLNPWSVAPWVIGVGAAYKGGAALWEGSSRGIPGDPLYKPTLVAPGVDVPTVRTGLPDEVLDPTGQFAIVTGTSFANSVVVHLATICVDWIGRLATTPQAAEWQRLVEAEMKVALLPIEASPVVLKRMFMMMAREMPGYEPHQVGCGYVDDDVAAKYFQEFTLAHFIKVFEATQVGKPGA